MRLVALTLLLTCTLAAQQHTSLYLSNTSGYPTIVDLASDFQNGHIYCGSVATGSHDELFVMRFHNSGQTLWTLTFPDTLSVNPASIITNNTGIYIAGTEIDTSSGSSNGFLMKMDYNGIVAWRNTITSPALKDIAQTSNGNFVATGGNCVISFDTNGTILWSHAIDISIPYLDYSHVTIDDKESCIYLFGSVDGPTIQRQGVTTKYDSVGNFIWTKRYDGNSMPFSWTGAIWNSSELICYGWFMVPAGINGIFYPIYITKMDTSGAISQFYCSPINGSSPESFWTSDALLMDTNTLLVAGKRENSPMLFTFDLNSFSMIKSIDLQFASGRIDAIASDNDSLITYAGNQFWINQFLFGQIDTTLTQACGWLPFTTGTGFLYATPLTSAHNHGIEPFAISHTANGQTTSFILDSCLFTDVSEIDLDFSALSLFPNPASSECKVQLSAAVNENTQVVLYNTLGEIVVHTTIVDGTDAIRINLKGLKTGMYIVQVDGYQAKRLQIVQD